MGAESTAAPPGAGAFEEEPTSETTSIDDVIEVLGNRRRRFTIHYLKSDGGEQVRLRDVADQVAAWENGKPVERLSYRERKRVKNALHQFHLPKMDDKGFVHYDSGRGTVGLSRFATEQDFYVDVLPKRDIPWGLYYLLLSAAALVVLLASWVGVFPFTAVSPLMWGVFLATALSVSSVVHYYDTRYRMRLGAAGTPPEVKGQ